MAGGCGRPRRGDRLAAASGCDATTGAGAGETSTETEPAVSPQQQIPVTITVQVTDARSAAAFIDALSRGPRLLATIDGTLEEGTLTVTALALVRTED